jgi:hypothetical protein
VRNPISLVIATFILVTLACSFNFSTANLQNVTMAKDPEGDEPTTVFNQDDTFYVVGELANAPDDTRLKAVWIAVDADGVEPNYQIAEYEVTGGGRFNFNFENDQLTPVGTYKVDLYLNDELAQTLEFEVEGDVVAEEPSATPTSEPEPTAEPTATPEPIEPTPTPEPAEPTPEPTESAQNSTGDTISITPSETPEEEYEPLPFKDEPYVHPSKAFTFAIPESWEGIDGDATSVLFGDDNSVVGVVFIDAGFVYDEDQMQKFIDIFVGNIIDSVGDSHEVLAQEVQPDDSIYVGTTYESDSGGGNADFFFEQRETVVFVLYFVTTRYEEMIPTWNEIIASYRVDPQAALAAAPAATATPAPPPTPAPPSGPSAPAGKGLLVFNNTTGVDFVIDVIGPTNDSQVIPPGSSKQFVLDPGHYIINGHSPGGDYAINAYEFDIAADQVFPLTLN